MRRRTRSLLAVAAAAALLAVPVAASADEHGGDLLRGTIVGNIAPSEGGQSIDGVASAGASWVLTSSNVRVRADGELRLKVRGLVVPGANKPNVVEEVKFYSAPYPEFSTTIRYWSLKKAD